METERIALSQRDRRPPIVSSRLSCIANAQRPFTTLIPIALENLEELIGRSFPNESSPESRLPHFSHTFPSGRNSIPRL